MKSFSYCFLMILLVAINGSLHGQSSYEIIWQKTLGGSGGDGAYSIAAAPDGGYIVVGSTNSYDGDVKKNHGKADAWVMKLDKDGNIVWQRTYGGSSWDGAYSVVAAPDGGYIVVGSTSSNDGDVSKNHGKDDAWVVKLDEYGNIIWQRTYGGSDDDVAFSIAAAPDGGYIVAGETSSKDGDVKKNHGEADVWVIKLDKDGNMVWQKTYGGSSWDGANSIAIAPDGGYIVAGWTTSNDGDVSGWHKGYNFIGLPLFDIWVIKLDKDGNIIWQKTYGGSDMDVANSIAAAPDGGYIVAGWTRSDDGDVKENPGFESLSSWVIRLDKDGNIVWQRTYGGSDDDEANFIAATPDGGYIVAGSTRSDDGDVKKNHGDYDIWVIKLDEYGNIIWQKTIGGSDDDEAFSVAATPDGGYIVAGETSSNDGDVRGWHEGYNENDNNRPYPDFCVIKLGQK